MKRILALILALVMAFSLMACGAGNTEEATEAKTEEMTEVKTEEKTEEKPEEVSYEGAELVVATWGWAEAGLMKAAQGFMDKYGCTIIVDPTSGNGDRLNKLMAEKEDPTADIALLTKSFAEVGIQNGLFEKIDTNVVTSLDGLYDFAVNAEGYGPVFSTCRYGIMYDAAALEAAGVEAPTSYQDLFDDKYAGMVILPDMTSTAGPYMLVAMAEAMGGSQEDVSAAMALMQEKKDNIVGYYMASSDVVNAFTTGEACITVFMDINMPGLIDAGLDMKWVDAAEGSFAAPAAINVVKGCKNPELAQLFVEYMISEETQNIIAECMNEAPVHSKATMAEELQVYLAYGEEAMLALKEFDEAFITEAKGEWIDTFQRTVNVQ